MQGGPLGFVVPVLVSCVTVAMGGLEAFAGPSPAEQQLYGRVAALYRAGRSAITSVECEYDASVNDLRRHCRYAQDGEMIHHASLVMSEDGKSGGGYEIAWDGQRIHKRSQLGSMTISADAARGKPSMPLPQDWVNEYLDAALGFVNDPGQTYALQSAGEVEYDGQPCVELALQAHWVQGTMTVRLAKDAGYWPVFVRVVRGDGSLLYQMEGVRYARFESSGNTLFFPVRASARSGAASNRPGLTDNRMELRVDEATLALNKPIAPERFALVPWPNEEVYEWETGRLVPPADPNWSPVGRVGFPWDHVATMSEANKQAQAAAPPPAPIAASAAGRREVLVEYLNIPVILGVILIASAGYWMYRQSRSS